jgi:hypothetical protein
MIHQPKFSDGKILSIVLVVIVALVGALLLLFIAYGRLRQFGLLTGGFFIGYFASIFTESMGTPLPPYVLWLRPQRPRMRHGKKSAENQNRCGDCSHSDWPLSFAEISASCAHPK